MNLNEKLNLLESVFGKYEDWDEETVRHISEDEKYFSLFDSELTGELMKRENDDIGSMIYTLNVGYSISESNMKFQSELSELEQLKENESADIADHNEFIKNILNSDNLYDRLNVYLLILSDMLMEKKIINELLETKTSKIESDLKEFESILLKVDVMEGLLVLQSGMELLYRIQEFFFEQTSEIIFTESPEFEELCNKVSDALMQILDYEMNNIDEGEGNGEKVSE